MHRSFFILIVCLSYFASVFGQADFKGLYIGTFDDADGYLHIHTEKDTVYVHGDIVCDAGGEGLKGINNMGVIRLTGNLVNRLGSLFTLSSLGNDNTNINASGNVHFIGKGLQTIKAENSSRMVFNNLFVYDSLRLESDIHVIGALKLEHGNDKPYQMLLGQHHIYMYDAPESGNKHNSGIIEGEDETHYITGGDSSSIVMLKQASPAGDTPNRDFAALEGMGLLIKEAPDDLYVIAKRRHHAQTAGNQNFNKYFELQPHLGHSLGKIGIRFFDHDFSDEYPEYLKLFYSDNGGLNYKKVHSAYSFSENRHQILSDRVESYKDSVRYTLGNPNCLNKPSVKLHEQAHLEACVGAMQTIRPVVKNSVGATVKAGAGNYHIEWNGEETDRDSVKIFTITEGHDTISVKVTDDVLGCENFDTLYIVGRPVPAAHIESFNDDVECITAERKFKTASVQSGVGYRWDLGDATLKNGDSISHLYLVANTYTVTMTATNQFNCTASDSIRIEAEVMPEAGFSVSAPSEKLIDLIDESNFYGSDTHLTSWSIPDIGQNGILSGSTRISFPDYGSYAVTLIAGNNKCRDTVTGVIAVQQKGFLDFEVAGSACMGATVAFVNKSHSNWGSMEFRWKFGDGAVSDYENDVITAGSGRQAVNPSHIYHHEGSKTYTVSLFAYDAVTAKTDSVSKAVTVYAPPQIAWSESVSTCKDEWILQPEAQEAGTSYQWGDGSTGATFTARQDGGYSLMLTDVHGCSSMARITVKLNDEVQPAIDDAVSCGSLLLDAGNSGNNSYLWTGGSAERTLLATRSGDYTVKVTQYNGCVGEKTVHIEIKTKPTVAIQGAGTLCDGATTVLSVKREASTSYLWNTAAADTEIDVSQWGWYSVTATHNQSACTAVDSVYVQRLNVPVVELGPDRNVCLGQETILSMDDYLGAEKVLWWDKYGQIVEGRRYAVRDTGTYYLKLIASNGCSATDRIRFTGVKTPLTIDFLNTSDAYVGDSVVFIDLSHPDPISWKWEISAGFSSDKPIFCYVFRNEGVYDVKLTVDNGGCAMSNTKQIVISRKSKAGYIDPDDPFAPEGSEVAVLPESETLYREPAQILEVITAPNPSNGAFRLLVTLAQPSPLVAQLYSIKGLLIQNFMIPKQGIEIDYSCFFKLPAGVYLLRLRSEADEKTVKIVIR
jgi:PKD repeat protein